MYWKDQKKIRTSYDIDEFLSNNTSLDIYINVLQISERHTDEIFSILSTETTNNSNEFHLGYSVEKLPLTRLESEHSF